MLDLPKTDPMQRRISFWPHVLIPLAITALLAPAVLADRVIRRNGDHIDGRVVSVDAESIVIETDRGRTRLDRAGVTSIEFEPAELPLKVELRVVQVDEAIDVLVHDEPILERARTSGGWIDISDRLKTGNNPIRLRIHNTRQGWAYRLSIRVNGQARPLECGTPYRLSDACRCCGKQGNERGVIDDLPVIWLWVDRELGTAELIEG